MKKLLFIIIFALCGSVVEALPHNALFTDSLEISLLTCEPGPAIYEHYGHTALRVKNGQGSDMVFNYGCFDFNTPFFGLRFALGQTDYLLGAYDFCYFEREYMLQSRIVWEQKLNLTPANAQALAHELYRNASPENRVYRYNFLYNNCTTKCRDLIEQFAGGTVVWPDDNRRLSIRDIMHHFNRPYPWSGVGIDLLLGGKIDRNSTTRERMFAPMLMMQYLETATVNGRPVAQPAVAIINPANPYKAPHENDMALCITMLFAIPLFILAFILYVCKRFTAIKRISAAVMCIVGIVGLVPTFLFFFSQHPAVGTNLLVLCFNPLPLFILFIRRPNLKVGLNIVAIFMALLCLLLGTWFNPRHGFEPIVLLQEIPATIYWMLLLHTAALCGYLLSGIYTSHVKDK